MQKYVPHALSQYAANDLARSIGIPQDIASAAEVIVSGVHRVIDLGLARPLIFSEQSVPHTCLRPGQQRLFAHALTVGLSVQFACVATNKTVRQRYGHLTYPFALWQAFKTYRPIDAEFHFEGVARRTPSSSFPIATGEHLILRSRIAQSTAVNAPIFWGPFEGTVPGVSFTDHFLDIVIFEDTGRHLLALRMLHFFNSRHQHSPDKQGWHAQYPDLLSAELTNIPGVHHVQARSLTIFTENEPQAVTLDGEVCTQTPVETRVADEQLRFLVPAPPLRHDNETDQQAKVGTETDHLRLFVLQSQKIYKDSSFQSSCKKRSSRWARHSQRWMTLQISAAAPMKR